MNIPVKKHVITFVSYVYYLLPTSEVCVRERDCDFRERETVISVFVDYLIRHFLRTPHTMHTSAPGNNNQQSVPPIA